jgi:hypothetical protein
MAEDIFNTDGGPEKNALDSFIETNSAKPAAPAKTTTGSSFMDELNDKTDFSAYTPQVKSDPTFAGPRDLSFGTSDMDKYTAQDDFEGKLFNPDDPANNMRFAERETWGSAMGKAFDDFSYKFGNTHNEGWKMYGRFADAALNGDMGKLALSETEMIENFYGDEENAAKNHVFMDPQYDDDIFSKRSMAEFIGNSGFALGTFAQFAEELVIDAVLTAVTLPAGGEGAASFGLSFGKLGATLAGKAAAKKVAKEAAEEGVEQVAKKSGFFTDVLQGANMSNTMSADDILRVTAGKIDQAADVANAARKASPFREVANEYFRIISLNAKEIAGSKTLGDLAINTAKGVPLLGTAIRQGEKIAAGAKAGLSTGVLTGMGLMGARRVAQELSMSLTEANFETVGSYGDTLDLMVNKYKEDHNNEPPPAEEFEKMRTQSLRAASANLKTNTALLLITNKIQFGNLFTKFMPSSRVVSELMEEAGSKILSTTGRNAAGNKMSKEYLKGFMGTYGQLGKIAQDFGKKQAGYEFGKQFLKDFARFEVSEGIQENLQETSNAGWRDYYAGQYNTTKYTVSQAFNKGLGEQFTKQGFKTFLQGALTGSMIRIPTKVATHLIEKGQNAITNSQYGKDSEDNPINIVKKQINDGINLRNDMYQQLAEKKFTHKVVNFNAQVTSALGQTEAAAKNSKYEWVNHNDNGVLAGAVSANQAGTIKAYAQAIRNMGQTTNAEEFEAMTGTSLSETKYSNPQEWADDMARDVEKYSKTVDSIRSKFKGMVDPAMYEKGSKDRIVASQHRAAQEEAVRLIALNSIKANNASERAQKVSQKFSEIKGITNSSEYGLRVLTNQGNLEAERGNIAAEVKLLEESLKGSDLDANTRKSTTEEIENKKQELELIDKWNAFFSTRGEVLGTEDKTPVFIGKHVGKVDVKDQDGNMLQAQQDTYDTKHDEVIDTFRKIINLKNKQGGNDTQLSEEDLRNGIEHVTDFINLDQDAKDYMESVNSLMNPAAYRTTITRMMDGNFKNILMNVVDNVQERVLDTVIDIFKITQNFDAALSMEEITKEINDALVNSEGYKKLLMLSVDPNLGIQNSEYAQEALGQFEQVLKTKLTEFVTKYNPDVFYNDIKDEDYHVFVQDNNKISFVYLESIAQKLVNGETLTSKQDAVYTAHKEKIDELKLNYTKVEAKILEEEEAEATTTTVFKNKDQQILEELQRQLDAEKGLSPDAQNPGIIDSLNESINEIETRLEGDLSNDEYNAFLQGDVSPELKQKLADKVKNQEPFKDRELDVATAYQQEIKDLNDPTKKPVVNEEEEEDFDVPDEETDETDEDNEPGFSIAQMMGETTETEEEEELQPGAEEPKTNFTVEENEEEGGFDVKDENGKSVTKDAITSEEEADELAKSMNHTMENVNFLSDLLEKRKDVTPITTVQKAVILTKLERSLKTHNTKNKTDFKNLEEYYNTPAGKEKINDLVEGVLTGKTVAELKAERKLALKDKKKESEISTDNVTVTPTVEVVSAVEALHKRLQSVTDTSTLSSNVHIDLLHKHYLELISYMMNEYGITKQEAYERAKEQFNKLSRSFDTLQLRAAYNFVFGNPNLTLLEPLVVDNKKLWVLRDKVEELMPSFEEFMRYKTVSKKVSFEEAKQMVGLTGNTAKILNGKEVNISTISNLIESYKNVLGDAFKNALVNVEAEAFLYENNKESEVSGKTETLEDIEAELAAIEREIQKVEEEVKTEEKITPVAKRKRTRKAKTKPEEQTMNEEIEKVEATISENITDEEVEDIVSGPEEDVTTREDVERVVTEAIQDETTLNGRSKSFKDKILALLAKITKGLLGLFLAASLSIGATGITTGNDGNITFDLAASVNTILGEDSTEAQWAKRYLDKKGLITLAESKMKVQKESTIVETPQVEKRFELLGTVVDAGYSNDSLMSYRSQWDNSKGFRYIPVPVKQGLPAGGMKIKGVIGVGHFLLDASMAGNTYSHEYNKAFLRKAKEKNDWVPTFTKNSDGSVNLKYKKANDVVNVSEIVVSPLRQFKWSDIDMSKTGTAVGFQSSIKEIKTEQGAGTYLLFKNRDGYGRFSGGSVVFIFNDSHGNTVVRDFAGSINQIEKEALNIVKTFKIAPEKLTLGYHDVGSFSAKPKAANGVIDTEQWAGYNNAGMTGGALLIPIEGNLVESKKDKIETLVAKRKVLKEKIETIKQTKTQEKSEKNAKFVEKDIQRASIENSLDDITSCL